MTMTMKIAIAITITMTMTITINIFLLVESARHIRIRSMTALGLVSLMSSDDLGDASENMTITGCR